MLSSFAEKIEADRVHCMMSFWDADGKLLSQDLLVIHTIENGTNPELSTFLNGYDIEIEYRNPLDVVFHAHVWLLHRTQKNN